MSSPPWDLLYLDMYSFSRICQFWTLRNSMWREKLVVELFAKISARLRPFLKRIYSTDLGPRRCCPRRKIPCYCPFNGLQQLKRKQLIMLRIELLQTEQQHALPTFQHHRVHTPRQVCLCLLFITILPPPTLIMTSVIRGKSVKKEKENRKGERNLKVQ